MSEIKKPLASKALHMMKYTLGPKVTPLAYVWAAKQITYGMLLAFTTLPGIVNLILFKADAGIGIQTYGITLMVTAIILFIGMVKKNTTIVRIASFAMVLIMFWSFAVYWTVGVHALAILILFDALGWGYVYLASSLNTLWDYSPLLSDEQKILDDLHNE